MGRDLAHKRRSQWVPQAGPPIEDDPDVVAPVIMPFVMKTSQAHRSAGGVDLKAHIKPSDPDALNTLCGRLLLADCTEVGAEPPSNHSVCARCLKASHLPDDR